MATLTEVHRPDIGDFTDVPVIEVLVAEGDTVAPETPLIVLETDKATMEVPSPAGGVVRGLAVSVGDTLSEGDMILTLDGDASGDGDADGSGNGAAAPGEGGIGIARLLTGRHVAHSGIGGNETHGCAGREAHQAPDPLFLLGHIALEPGFVGVSARLLDEEKGGLGLG